MFSLRNAILFVGAALSVTAPDGRADTRAREVFVATSPNVFRIRVLDSTGAETGARSAVAWSDGHLVSRCDDATPSFELLLSDRSIPATLHARDPDSRLCLLHVEWPVAPPVAEIADLPEPGTRVFAVGNTMGLGVGISEGVVAAIHRRSNATRIQFTASISSGSDGGGLFDEQGRLIGIIDQPLQGGQNVNFAVPASAVQGMEARAAAQAFGTAEREQWVAQAEALRQRGSWNDLRIHADAWMERHPDDAEALIARADASAAGGDTAAASRDFERAVALDPGSRAARFGLLRMQIARQDVHAAATARSLTDTWPGDASAWIARAQAQAATGDHDGADASVRQALTLHPWSPAALDLLARTAQARGRTDAWIDHRARLFDLSPEDPAALMNYADALLSAGRAAQALALIEAVPAYRNSGDLLYYHGRALQAAGRPSDALRSFELGLDNGPRAPAWVWAGIGGIHYEKASWQPAIAAFRKATELDPGEPGWRWSLGVTLKDAGHADEALGIFSALVAEAPQRAEAWRQLGFVQSLLGHPDAAIEALERSLALDARQPQAWHALIELYALKVRTDDVRRAWARLRDLDPARAEAARLCCIVPLDIVE